MNKRIRELARDHDLDITIDGMGYGEGNIEGLANMIIQECMAVCMSRVGNRDYNTGRLNCRFDIKEHFGIEE